MTIYLAHVALPSPILVWMVHYCDQSYFGWTCSPLLITLLQNIMFNSWISQFCKMQLGVALQKDNCCACEVFEWLERQGVVVQAAGDGERCERSVSWGSHCSGRVKPIIRSKTFRGQRGEAGNDWWEKTTLERKWVSVEKHLRNTSSCDRTTVTLEIIKWESKRGISFNES